MFLRPFAFKILHLYWRLRRGMTLGARVAVFDQSGAVLLVRHTYTEGWHLPGGGVEPGHTFLQTAVKELREEAGLVATETPRLHGIFLNAPFVRDHVAVFVLHRYDAGRSPVPNREIAEAGFFPVGALPPGTTDGTRRRLAEIAGDADLREGW